MVGFAGFLLSGFAEGGSVCSSHVVLPPLQAMLVRAGLDGANIRLGPLLFRFPLGLPRFYSFSGDL
jgi:hypothetical protein